MKLLKTTFLTGKTNPQRIEQICFWLSLVCALLFIYTAQTKITDHMRFMNGLSRVELIGNYARAISWAVPVMEILVAVLILIPWTTKTGLWGFLGLMIVFTVYILTALIWAQRLPCHCGGVIETLSWVEHLWFNLGFIALSIIALWLVKLKNLNKNFKISNNEQH